MLDSLPNALFLQQSGISGSFDVAAERDDRRAELVQLKPRLQQRSVDKPAVHADVANLPGKNVLKHLPRCRRIDEQNRGKAPKQAVPVPVRGAHIIAGTAGSDEHILLAVQRQAAAKEEAEEEVQVQQFVQLGVANRTPARLQPVQRFVPFKVESTAEHLLGGSCRRDLFEAKAEPEHRFQRLSRLHAFFADERKGNSFVRPLERACNRAGFGCFGYDWRERKERKTRALVEHKAVIPAAVVSKPFADDRLGFVNRVLAECPAAVQPVRRARSFAFVREPQPNTESSFADGRKKRAFQRKFARPCGKRGNPVAVTCPTEFR